MYNQYQQYNQYQHQQSSSPSMSDVGVGERMEWNGTWVAHQNNQQPLQLQNYGPAKFSSQSQQHSNQSQIIPSNPVQTYTNYYHGWKKREEELGHYLKTLHCDSNSHERQTAESNRQWAQYYAEESSRAAHHFHHQPQATSAPFSLPPAPPTQRVQNSNKSCTASTTSNSSSAQTTSSAGSLTRYVKRNMERYQVQHDPQLTKRVQAEIEKKIADAIQKGVLQSRNWEEEPLIVLDVEQKLETALNQAKPHTKIQPKQQQQKPYNDRHNYEHVSSVQTSNYYGNYENQSTREDNTTNYYGPASPPLAKYSGGNTANNNYYGPSSHNASVQRISNYNSSSHSLSQFTAPSFSSSSSQPSNKEKKESKNNKRRHHHHQEEDFMSLECYGPISASKKTKRNCKNNTTVTMHNAGLDVSQKTLAKRANRFSGLRAGIIHGNANGLSTLGESNICDHDKYMGKRLIGGTNLKLDETDYEKMTVKGTSKTLEKDFLRLTAPPRPELVRPLGILQQHLRNLQCEYYGLVYDIDKSSVKKDEYDFNSSKILREKMRTPQYKWKIPNGNGDDERSKSNHCRRHDYLWFCSQLKAIRQDCTVQRIQGDFAIDVYETHARIALQEGDLNEYNQCQTQLKERVWKHQEEFIAYRLLYYVYLSTNEKYSGGSSDMFHIMSSLTSKERDHPAIHHALQVREAFAFSDYFRFFRLHNKSPNLGIFLTELLVHSMRLRGLRRIAKAYRPSIDLSVCLQQLGFYDSITCRDNADNIINESDGKDSRTHYTEVGKSWLISCGGVIDGSKFITKDSNIHAPNTKKVNSLI